MKTGICFHGYCEIEAEDLDNAEFKFFNHLFNREICIDECCMSKIDRIEELAEYSKDFITKSAEISINIKNARKTLIAAGFGDEIKDMSDSEVFDKVLHSMLGSYDVLIDGPRELEE